jgi:uncharacterized protein with GYD domain
LCAVPVFWSVTSSCGVLEHITTPFTSPTRFAMPRYLIEGYYTEDGTKGLLQEGGTRRRDTVTKMIEGMGGTMECLYYTFGARDVIAIYTVPDEATAAALALTVNQSGKVRITTHVLMTPEEVDEATKKTIAYRAPGT